MGLLCPLLMKPSLGWEDPLEKGMATHSSILAWKVARAAEPGGLQSVGSHGVGQDWASSTHDVCVVWRMWKAERCVCRRHRVVHIWARVARNHLCSLFNTQLLLSRKVLFCLFHLFPFYYEKFETFIKVESIVQGSPYTHLNTYIKKLIIFVLFFLIY